MYILEFLCRKDKVKELLVLCRFNFQLIKFPTIISDSRGRKRGELFGLMEDSFWKFIYKSPTTGKLVLNNYSQCLVAHVSFLILQGTFNFHFLWSTQTLHQELCDGRVLLGNWRPRSLYAMFLRLIFWIKLWTYMQYIY